MAIAPTSDRVAKPGGAHPLGNYKLIRKGVRTGFTLVELVMVVAITGLISISVARFIAAPVQGHLDTTRRAMLVDQGQGAMARMVREVRLALPNSIRIHADGQGFDFVRVRTGGRYREEGPGDSLDFNAATDSFDVLGGLPSASSVNMDPSAAVGSCGTPQVDCLTIYNTGQAGASAHALDNVAVVTAASSNAVSFSGTAAFPLRSPARRFYIVDHTVNYRCEAGVVRRYAGYPLQAVVTAVDTHAETTGLAAMTHLLSDRVDSCRFSYQAGTATRASLMSLVLSLGAQGEGIALVEQVHVRNLP